MASFPFDKGNPVMKLRETVSKGLPGIAKGCRYPSSSAIVLDLLAGIAGANIVSYIASQKWPVVLHS